MKPRVYIETSVFSYLTARPSRDVIRAGHQQATIVWWDERRKEFDLCASQLVVKEAGAGDAVAAAERMAVIDEVPLMSITESAVRLAEQLLREGALPAKAGDDALHVAIAAVNGVDYLLTWNMRHINNPALKPFIEVVCRQAGYKVPVICTPDELLEV